VKTEITIASYKFTQLFVSSHFAFGASRIWAGKFFLTGLPLICYTAKGYKIMTKEAGAVLKNYLPERINQIPGFGLSIMLHGVAFS